MNAVLQMTPALDQFMPETMDSHVEPVSPSHVFDLGDLGLTRLAGFSFRRFSWLVSMLAILYAGYSGFEGFRDAHGAAEQAAAAGITLTIALVPYLFARSVEAFVKSV